MTKISEIVNNVPFDAEYIPVSEIIGKPMTILDAVPFDSQAKGPGVHALIDIDGSKRRICTHAVALCEVLSRQDVIDAAKAEGIHAKIVMAESKTNRGRQFPVLEDA